MLQLLVTVLVLDFVLTFIFEANVFNFPVPEILGLLVHFAEELNVFIQFFLILPLLVVKILFDGLRHVSFVGLCQNVPKLLRLLDINRRWVQIHVLRDSVLNEVEVLGVLWVLFLILAFARPGGLDLCKLDALVLFLLLFLL